MLIDLTNLAKINHFHGYDVGDKLLHKAYKQLLELSKLPNAVYRLGSHRFSFILPDLGNPAFIALAMNRVHRSLEAKLLEDATALGVDVKIGIAINRLGVRDFMATLAQAEASLSHVKLGGIQRIDDVLAEDKANSDQKGAERIAAQQRELDEARQARDRVLSEQERKRREEAATNAKKVKEGPGAPGDPLLAGMARVSRGTFSASQAASMGAGPAERAARALEKLLKKKEQELKLSEEFLTEMKRLGLEAAP